jgi:hypothetical protein
MNALRALAILGGLVGVSALVLACDAGLDRLLARFRRQDRDAPVDVDAEFRRITDRFQDAA